MLDAGANVDCPPERLASFALLGVAHARALGVAAPRVGLLSNGEELSKGSQVTRAALPLLQNLPVHVVGNVEPTGALAGACDVLVCDGFMGNAVLKAAEGAVSMAAVMLMEETRRSPLSQMALWMFRPALRRFERRVSWDTYGGGLLLGTEGVFVVGHGRSTPRAVAAAIAAAAVASPTARFANSARPSESDQSWVVVSRRRPRRRAARASRASASPGLTCGQASGPGSRTGGARLPSQPRTARHKVAAAASRRRSVASAARTFASSNAAAR